MDEQMKRFFELWELKMLEIIEKVEKEKKSKDVEKPNNSINQKFN